MTAVARTVAAAGLVLGLAAAAARAGAPGALDLRLGVLSEAPGGDALRDYDDFGLGADLGVRAWWDLGAGLRFGLRAGYERLPVRHHEYRTTGELVRGPGLEVRMDAVPVGIAVDLEVPVWRSVSASLGYGAGGLYARKAAWGLDFAGRASSWAASQWGLYYEVEAGIALAHGSRARVGVTGAFKEAFTFSGRIWPEGRNPRFLGCGLVLRWRLR